MLIGKDSEAVWGGLSLKKFSDWLATGLGAGPGGSSGAVLSHPPMPGSSGRSGRLAVLATAC